MQIRAKDDSKEFGSCGCGRSPTGKCIGWHGLSEEKYQEKLSQWEIEDYKRKAQELWSDSCTTERSDNSDIK
jgi:hypothetical protein